MNDMKHLVDVYDDTIVAKVLSSCRHRGYSYYALRFNELADEAGAEDLRQLYRELGDVCCARLEINSRRQPYRFIHKVFTGVNPARIELYAALSNLVSDALLSARLADFVWTFADGDVDKIPYAKRAINCYCKLPLLGKDWRVGLLDCYLRAVQIAKGLGESGRAYLTDIANRIDQEARSGRVNELKYAAEILNFVNKSGVHLSNSDALANKILLNVEQDGGESYLVRCEALDSVAVFLARVKKQPSEALVANVKKAKVLMSVGKEVLDGGGDKRLAGARYEEAERVLNAIPKAIRARYDVETLLAECREKSRAGYIDWNEHLQLFESPPVDLREQIAKSVAHVRGLPLERSFPSFAFMYDADVDGLKQATLDALSGTALWMICQKTILTEDGRAERTIPAYDPRDPESEDSKLRLDSEIMTFMYPNDIKFAVRGCLYPAYQTIKTEYDVPGQLFYDMCRQADFIPEDRVLSCTRALFLGWNGDFDSAAKLLVPQIENIIRSKLRMAKVETRHRNVAHTTETENGLSQLVVARSKELESLVGKNCACELRWLFGPAPYLNMRNVYAHGLVGDVSQDSFSIIAFYLWWFFLSRVVRACCVREESA